MPSRTKNAAADHGDDNTGDRCPNCGYCPHCGQSAKPRVLPQPYPVPYPAPYRVPWQEGPFWKRSLSTEGFRPEQISISYGNEYRSGEETEC